LLIRAWVRMQANLFSRYFLRKEGIGILATMEFRRQWDYENSRFVARMETGGNQVVFCRSVKRWKLKLSSAAGRIWSKRKLFSAVARIRGET
jgi:hypothetical protein